MWRCNTDAFTHRRSYAETLLHKDAFTYTDAFTHRHLLHTLWEFVICVGTLESWACRRLEYPKSPGGLMQQNWSNWSNWRIDAAKLIKLEQLCQQFKPKCRYVCTTSWMGLRWPVPSMSPRAPCECQNDQSNNWPFVIMVFTHTHRPLRENFSRRRGETSECETWNTNIELENRCRHEIQLVLWNAKTEQLSNRQVFRVRQFTHVCYGNLFLSSLFVCVFVRFTSWNYHGWSNWSWGWGHSEVFLLLMLHSKCKLLRRKSTSVH